MDLRTFIKEIQIYYNLRYPVGTLKVILSYLEKTNTNLDELYDNTVLTFSGKYKVLPDVADSFFFIKLVCCIKPTSSHLYVSTRHRLATG